MISRFFVLAFLLTGSLISQIRVVNDGFPGENTAELDSRLSAALIQFRPHFVVLFAGTNDALNEKKFLPAQETAAHLDAMVQRIKASGAQTILVSIHDPDLTRLMARHKPEAYGTLPPLERLGEVNKQLLEIAKREHVALVPFSSILREAGGTNTELSTDGVHLTAKGYGLLAAAVRREMPKHLPADTTVLCFGDSLTYGIGVRPAGSASENAQTYPSQLRSLLN